MHDGMPYGRNQGQGQGHSREVDRQSPTGLIFPIRNFVCKTKLFEIFDFKNAGLRVRQGHCKCHHSIERIGLPVNVLL